MNETASHNKKWDFFTSVAHCKFVVKSKPGLNGKIIVEIKKVKEVKLEIYMQPNIETKEYGTHGILENSLVFNGVNEGNFTVPTDWAVFLIYNPSFFPGEISINSYVQELNEDD
jgi:hypothetical protein